ncbi:MAG: hypothetical protein QXH80_02855, partial [Candidatus Nanoarchaeia archaeon]
MRSLRFFMVVFAGLVACGSASYAVGSIGYNDPFRDFGSLKLFSVGALRTAGHSFFSGRTAEFSIKKFDTVYPEMAPEFHSLLDAASENRRAIFH